ncbi:MAG: hypothetical protein IPF64_00395 [Flavobacteriales bacterium]|nr:hypothetical protein [Flavobacteriales bacterium]
MKWVTPLVDQWEACIYLDQTRCSNCGGSNPSVVQSADPVVQQDTWQHIALVHRTDTILIYLNGERVISTLVQNSFGNVQTNAQSLLIGAYRNQAGVISTTSFGQLDELEFGMKPEAVRRSEVTWSRSTISRFNQRS